MNLATNRRNLLAGLAAASTAVIGGTASANVSHTGEQNARLIELAEELSLREAAFLEAQDKANSIYRETMAVWPLAPDEITYQSNPLSGTLERDVAGRGLARDGSDKTLGVRTPDELISDVEWCRDALKEKRIQRSPSQTAYWEGRLADAQRDLEVSERYFAECDRLTEASGYIDASEAVQETRHALHGVVNAIIAERETSMEGVAIKAQALAAWAAVPDFHRALSLNVHNWGPEFAKAVLRQAQTTEGART